MIDSANLHSGDVITIRQGSMEVYEVALPRLRYLGNLQHGSNATRYAGIQRVYPDMRLTIDGRPVRIERSKINGRPVVVAQGMSI